MPHLLTSPIALRGLTLRNRIVISPMCQYSATEGRANDWHMVQYGRFAVGGAGLVIVEATGVTAQGRGTHGDLGLWDDAQVAPLARICDFVKAQGAGIGLQLVHAGRKAAAQRPFHGGAPLPVTGVDARGETAWPTLAPSPVAIAEGWQVPGEMTLADLDAVRVAFADAARRAVAAGFDVLELHAAHGYLLHEFLSPLSNLRTDAYGGDAAGRMRFPLEVVSAVRAVWPEDRPLFVRVSAVDHIDGGLELADTVGFAHALKAAGVDVVDCSSGGILGAATAGRVPRGPGFQVPYAQAVRDEAGIATMAVGLITDPAQAEAILAAGQADLIAIGREALDNPNWPLHAHRVLEGDGFAHWPPQHGWWLERRAALLRG